VNLEVLFVSQPAAPMYVDAPEAQRPKANTVSMGISHYAAPTPAHNEGSPGNEMLPSSRSEDLLGSVQPSLYPALPRQVKKGYA
jgi:hypothetical protein